jgi:hypothetical protein
MTGPVSALQQATPPERTGASAAGQALGSRRRETTPVGGDGGRRESGSGGFEPNPLGDRGGMRPPSVNPGNTAQT